MDIILEKVDVLNGPQLTVFYQRLISEGQTFWINATTDYYCPNITTNKISILVGVHLKYLLSQKACPPQKNSEFLSYFICNYFFGQFCSKLINPYKKCNLYIDLLKKSKSQRISQEKQNIYLNTLSLLEQIDTDKIDLNFIKKLELFELFYIAKNIGHLLGHLFFKNIDRYTSDEIITIRGQMVLSNVSLKDFPSLFSMILKDLPLKDLKKDFF
jgi:hypothetical protein